jgi:hypothetical protein
MMNRTTPLTIVFLLACLLAACGEAEAGIPVTGQESDLRLDVASPNGESAFRQGDGAITYNYVVTNTGPQSLRGPVIVNDAPRVVTCPQLETVGDLDSELDFNESITCTAMYTPDEAERSAGSITNRAQANVGGKMSNESTFTLGQAAATGTVRGEGEGSTPMVSPTPSAIASATQQSITAEPTGTPPVIPTATQGASADSTGTPSVIPTATELSPDGGTSGPTASADSVNVIDLPAGTEAIVLPGIVPAGGVMRYSIDAAAGQQLSLNFIVSTTQLTLSVTGPDGAPVKTPEAAIPWSETVSSAGDYLIEIVNMDGAAVQPYVLELRRTD